MTERAVFGQSRDGSTGQLQPTQEKNYHTYSISSLRLKREPNILHLVHSGRSQRHHLRQPVQDAQRSDGGGFEADISTGDGDVSPWAVKTRLIRVRGRSCWRSSRRGMCLRSAACCASDIIEIIDEPVSMQFAAALRSAATAHRRSSSPIWQESRRRSCSGLA
jgi:hypothetical protein